uniref:Surfeit 6 n=1 Tax=Sphenodon punctatus TaxID=8508 RepID=A0A8D0HL54_SPHPU
MASLATKDSYLQSLAKKICVREIQEPRKRKLGSALFCSYTWDFSDRGSVISRNWGFPIFVSSPCISFHTDSKTEASSFSAVNLLRQRLHEKIQEASGQGSAKELSPAVLEKRRRRKYEKERKKRRRKEMRMKEKMEKGAQEEAAAEKKEESKAEILFNRVEIDEELVSKAQKRKEKQKGVKGNLTPLTGKNYKQLLGRLEARKSKLEELKDKDEKKAQALETKMKWTNVLYKAEGIKIRDNEDRLKAALKRKEKLKAQRQKQWEKRTEHVVEKMQQRQDKRRKNIQRKKIAKVERKKKKARKKGRILPEDLEKAGLK